MTDRLRQRLGDPRVAHDTRLLGDFARIYCDGKHADRAKAAVTTAGSELWVYGAKPLELCEECRELLEYAEKRRAFCPQDKPGASKPFCSHCETHCYQPDKRELMRDVMRYAGPRAVVHGHAVDSVRHLIEGHKHAAEMRRREAGDR